MRIRIKDSYCMLSTGALAAPGEEHDVPDEEGRIHCQEGLAEPVAQRVKTEKAVTRKRSEKR